MLKIRLQRTGRINNPSYRIVVTDSKHAPQSGKSLEVLGSFNPKAGKPEIKADRVKHWMSVGAGVSTTMHNMLVSAKIIEGKKINALPKKTAPKKEEVKEEKVEVGEKKEEAVPVEA